MPKPSLKVIATSPARSVSPIYMSILEWGKMPIFEGQRNHDARANDPRNIEKFSDPLTTHWVVQAGMLPDGTLFKLDGHTRTEIWKALGVSPPEVLVLLHHVADMNEAKKLYLSIDERRSAKNSADEIYSAMREAKFKPLSPLISSCQFNEALSIAARRPGRGYPKSEQMKDVMPVLRMFDKVLPDRTVFPTPITVAALLSIMRDGTKAVPFWKSYMKGEWEHGSAQSALAGYIERATWGKRADTVQAAGRCLAVYLLWAEDCARKVCDSYPFTVHGPSIITQFKAELS